MPSVETKYERRRWTAGKNSIFLVAHMLNSVKLYTIGMAMRMQVVACSDVGLQRANNEDMAMLNGETVRDTTRTMQFERGDETCLLAVADGVGGAVAGEVASAFVVTQLQDAFQTLSPTLSSAALAEEVTACCVSVNSALIKSAGAEHRGMATTLTALLFYEQQMLLTHAGDSRCYLYHSNRLKQISRDHTMRELYNAPHIPSNYIANCFGTEQDFFVDCIPINRAHTRNAHDVYRFLLCTDGLSDMVSDRQIETCMAHSKSLQKCSAALLHCAYQSGAHDNITAVIIDL